MPPGRKVILFVLCAAWAAASALFVLADFAGVSARFSDYYKYTVIITCVFIAFTASEFNQEKLLKAAMLLTAAADLFILVLLIYTPGIVIFCAAHTLYAVRNARNVKILLIHIVSVASSFVCYIITNDALVSVSLLYVCCLLINAGSSLFTKKRRFLIITGMALFLCCDVCVLLYNTPSFRLNSVAGPLIWLFYAPSQLLLALSGVPKNKDAKVR